MMGKLDQRGDAAFQLVALFSLFTLMCVIFDAARYAITMQSLRTLANAGARATMIACYTPAVIANTSPSGCTADYLTAAQKQGAAPFLYRNGSSSPTVSTTTGAAGLTVTASQSSFAMVMPIWGSRLNAPSASVEIPF
jgi:hypothetical protein